MTAIVTLKMNHSVFFISFATTKHFQNKVPENLNAVPKEEFLK